ncbi:MAG: YceI family protein [Chitinophagaceae bacterium]
MIFTFSIARAQQFTPIDNSSRVHFVIKNFGINTGGDLKGLKGNIYFDPNNMRSSKIAVAVDASTVDTDSESRDNHIKGEDYFDVERNPEITIRSTSINYTKESNKGRYLFTGNLTLAGITRPISFIFQVKRKGTAYIFTGDFEINRLDYNVGESSSVLSNTVKVSLSVFAKKG